MSGLFRAIFSLLSEGFEQERPEICVNRRCLNEEVRGRRVVRDVGVVREEGCEGCGGCWREEGVCYGENV